MSTRDFWHAVGAAALVILAAGVVFTVALGGLAWMAAR